MREARRRLEYKIHLPQHLLELSHLTNRSVAATDLLSLSETVQIRERSKVTIRQPSYQGTLPFLERNGSRMTGLVRAIEKIDPGPVYLWTEHANVCGALKLSSILEFRLDFDFQIEANGVLTLQTETLDQKMILDFAEESGAQTLEIELLGSRWGMLRF